MDTKVTEYTELFLSEGEEILASLNNTLIELEKDPSSPALIDEVFRLSHTLKSMAQSMGYDRITVLTHSMENALAAIRQGSLTANKETVNLLFRAIDVLSQLVDEVKDRRPVTAEVNPLLEEFERLASLSRSADGKTHPDSAGTDAGGAHLRRRNGPSGPPPPIGDIRILRVPVTRFDTILDTAGELAIGTSRLMQVSGKLEDSQLKSAVSRVSGLAGLLQDQIMQIRLIPLAYLFTPYPRMVRDIAAAQGKEVDLTIEGADLGMDRGIQDEINEPLLHLLKNAVTHGIEKPAERENLGKPRRGRITLSARRERSSIVMDLSDDGRGMDIDDIRNNALKAGFATAQDLSRLSPHEVVMLAARPGYSGSAQVTEISGRGVGLNASKVKVESLGGALNIETVPGHGTTLHIRLPLTLAVVQALLATVGTETYCLPLASVAATLKVFPERVARVGGWEVMSYGDKTLPLIRLRDRFRIPHGQSGPHRANQGTPSSGMDVVVVEAGSSRAGLVISGLLGTADVVVKPLPRLLAGATGVSGATILSDGRVALILDVGYLLSQGETPWGP